MRLSRKQNYDKDHYERMNFLHQLSLMALKIHPPLSRVYTSELKRVSRRTVIRLSSNVRRTYCRKCLRATFVRSRHVVKSGRSKFVMQKCLSCGLVKRHHVKLK